MLVELIVKQFPEISIEGYEEIKLSFGTLYSNPIEKRVEILVKKRADGKVIVYTDISEGVK
ncbi:MAG: hypothetical protein J7K49_02585 [Thaumarchaeota archaeon]|nr:hypothetical protein [Nitrososphaerota archaeon]